MDDTVLPLKILKDNRGSILVFVLFLFVSVMVAITSLLVLARQNYNGVVTQQLNTRAYYITMESADVSVAALLQEDSYGSSLLDELIAKTDTARYAYVNTGTINYSDSGSTSKIKLIVQKDNDLNEDWAIIYITTVIPDYRVNVGDSYDPDKTYTYKMYYEMKVLLSDPSVRAFDVLTSDMAN